MLGAALSAPVVTPLDPCSDVSTHRAVTLGLILPERAVEFNKKFCRVQKERKKRKCQRPGCWEMTVLPAQALCRALERLRGAGEVLALELLLGYCCLVVWFMA